MNFNHFRLFRTLSSLNGEKTIIPGNSEHFELNFAILVNSELSELKSCKNAHFYYTDHIQAQNWPKHAFSCYRPFSGSSGSKLKKTRCGCRCPFQAQFVQKTYIFIILTISTAPELKLDEKRTFGYLGTSVAQSCQDSPILADPIL